MLKSRRRKFNGFKFGHLGAAGDGVCGVCYQHGPRVWHHIVALSRGGPNREENVVAICDGCHEKVHPWMKTPKEQLLPDEAYKPIWA